MITNVPTPDEFRAHAEDVLNVAWTSILEFYHHLGEADVESWDDDGEVTAQFWAAAQRSLLVAATLIHQAADASLQSAIADVSPFLLIASPPREWPGGCTTADTEFSAFRSHDSRELPRVYDTVVDPRLEDSTKHFLETLRELRNRAVHTVDRLAVDPGEVLEMLPKR